jgi:hypothetical protein
MVPATMGRYTIHHGVSENLKHITIVACLAASGEHVIPYVIRSQESDNLRQGLSKKGIEFRRHLRLKKSQKAYVNGKSFAESGKSTFVPHVMKGRVDGGIEEQEAALLIDNYPRHITGDVMDSLTGAAVPAVTFAPRYFMQKRKHEGRQHFVMTFVTESFVAAKPIGNGPVTFFQLSITMDIHSRESSQLDRDVRLLRSFDKAVSPGAIK